MPVPPALATSACPPAPPQPAQPGKSEASASSASPPVAHIQVVSCHLVPAGAARHERLTSRPPLMAAVLLGNLPAWGSEPSPDRWPAPTAASAPAHPGRLAWPTVHEHQAARRRADRPMTTLADCRADQTVAGTCRPRQRDRSGAPAAHRKRSARTTATPRSEPHHSRAITGLRLHRATPSPLDPRRPPARPRSISGARYVLPPSAIMPLP
jgi:hypothetical protein